MAAIRRGNTFYCPPLETNDYAPTDNQSLKVFGIFVTNTSGTDYATSLYDFAGTDASLKLSLVSKSSSSTFYSLNSSPMIFGFGLRVVTGSNTHVTLVFRAGGS